MLTSFRRIPGFFRIWCLLGRLLAYTRLSHLTEHFQMSSGPFPHSIKRFSHPIYPSVRLSVCSEERLTNIGDAIFR